MGIREDLGRQLRNLLDSHGLSERELERRCGVDHSNINHYTNAERWPSSQMLERILDYFDAEVQIVERKNKGDPWVRILDALEELGADEKLIDCVKYMVEPLGDTISGEKRAAG